MIRKILVANRGEIALRVMRSCREMGIASVAVFSEADRASRHVFYADEAYCIGGAASQESYLNGDRILEVARGCGADAIHPGYGFLSENASFARKCGEAGIIFIGPAAETIELMGDKISARRTMIEAGVPVVPGTQQNLVSADEAVEVCRRIGFPVMLKASQGGGGKGMRLVRREADVREAFEAARSEAMASFGDDTVYIERFVEEPHHIEFQVLGDRFGHVIHLCERECSVQRRHQKIIEESPSPLMTAELRERMGRDAVAAARAVGYLGAGTVEFLVDRERNYYFLEMNTRLQVEHPITEEVCGVDLVKEQIFVADGRPLRLTQRDIVQRGHAIECRICAEDASAGFMPSPGVISQLTEPGGIGVRLDSYIYEKYEIPVHYDPMIGKLIVWATTREFAVERMRRALDEYKITGVKTNIAYLGSILELPELVGGDYNTSVLEKNADRLALQQERGDREEIENMAMITALINYMVSLEEGGAGSPAGAAFPVLRAVGANSANATASRAFKSKRYGDRNRKQESRSRMARQKRERCPGVDRRPDDRGECRVDRQRYLFDPLSGTFVQDGGGEFRRGQAL